MVNNKKRTPPTTANPSDAERRIDGGSLYLLSDVQVLAQNPACIYLITRKCKQNVASMEWSNTEIAELLLELTDEHYRNSEWCNTNIMTWLACDAYAIKRRVYNDIANKTLEYEYFCKFAIGPNGEALLFVSCHS